MLKVNHKPNGYILYNGPSRIDKKPIIAVLTGVIRPSNNGGTGPMLHTWILCRDVDPVTAYKIGADYSICGDCPVHPWCYVNVGQAPLQVWKAYQRGSYPVYSKNLHLPEAPIRIGTYGDPYSVPVKIWNQLLSRGHSHTGYTHQWRKSDSSRYKKICVASTENIEDTMIALSRGWSTFRIRDTNSKMTKRERSCAKDNGGHCHTCLKCNGDKQTARSVKIHGYRANPFGRKKEVKLKDMPK